MGLLWRNIGRWGITPQMAPQQQRALLLTNSICLVLVVLSVLHPLLTIISITWNVSVLLVLLAAFFFAGVLFLNRKGYIHFARIALTIFFPLATLSIAIAHKLNATIIEEFTFFGSRMVLVIGVMLPMLIFSVQERRMLYGGIFIFGATLLLYEPAHALFGIGYYQLGFVSRGYLFLNIMMFILFALLVAAFLYYKQLLERVEGELWRGNRQLSSLYNELGRQHEKILQQTDKLIDSQQLLQEANQLIEQQKELLEAENLQLHQHLLEKNKILQASNEALHRRLDELQQFSYTISHNLRGPVASLLGLTNLFKPEEMPAGNRELLMHMRTAALALDAVIRDLSQVLQMRDSKEVAEPVNLPYLLENVLLSLKQEIEQHEVQIVEVLEVKEVQAIKSYLYSILYNLISNAIKYRHPQRACKITIRTRQVKRGVLLQVEDKGIGIDLKQHGSNLFKMYKRFHVNYEGRGLGLYLIKTQVEYMGGFVEVESQPGEGTTFHIWLPQDDEKQR